MSLTRRGRWAAAMAALTFAAAASSGNNLLYLLFSTALAALALAWGAGRMNLRRLRLEAEVPEQVFRGIDFTLRLRLVDGGAAPSFAVWAAGPGGRIFAARVDPGGSADVDIRHRLAHRGLNVLSDLSLESAFPFGLFRHRRPVAGGTATALPRLRELRGPGEVAADCSRSGAALLRKGRGGEFYGIRDYHPADDARSINWKLSAKVDRPLVTEFTEAVGSKVTVRLAAAGPGEEAERRIEEAASACRYFIDTGAEVRLVTPEAEVDYGKGVNHLDKMLRTLAWTGEGSRPRPAPDAPQGAAEPGEGVEDLRRLTFAGMALVAASLFLIDDAGVWSLASLAALLPVGWLLQERGGPWLPPAVWNALSWGMLLYAVLYDWRVSGITTANTHLITYLLANKALNPLRSSETHQVFLILYLAFFLVSGQTITLWYFPFFLAYAAFGAAWLSAASGLRLKDWRGWGPATAALWAAGLALAAAAFAVLPRVEPFYRFNPLVAAMGLDKLQARASSVTGFTENVSLGFFGTLKKSGARVMRVRPVPAPSPGSPGGGEALRIRGAAFDEFDGRRWSKSRADFRYRFQGRTYWSAVGRAWAPRRGSQIYFPSDARARNSPALEYTVYPMNTSVLFSAYGLWAVEEPENVAYFDHTDSAYFGAPYQAGIQYRVYGSLDTIGFSANIEDYGRFLEEHYLQLPARLDPRVRELAARITAAAPGDDLAQALAVESYLRRAYAYSTFSADPGTGLEGFLFKTKAGNCEYFATAAAVLLRAAGVPTRLVTGFLAQDWNEYGLFYDVRQSQAHAWTEAWVKDRGWIALDPTPPEDSASAWRSGALAVRMSRWFDAVQARWYRHVIGYDRYVQRNTFHRLGLAISRRAVRRGLAAAAALAMALGLALAAARALSRLRAARRVPAGFFARAQRTLERAGLPREPHWTPLEYARWVGERRPALAAVRDLAELHYRERYARAELSPDERRRAEEILAELSARAFEPSRASRVV